MAEISSGPEHPECFVIHHGNSEIDNSHAATPETTNAEDSETVHFYSESRAFKLMKTNLDVDGMNLLNQQLAILVELNRRPLESTLRNALKGDITTLPKGTLLHGMGMYEFSVNAIKSVAENGILSGELIGILEDSETHGCADFFRVPEEMSISQYFTWARETEFLGGIRKAKGERLLTRGVVFIVDTQVEGMDKLLENDGYSNSVMSGFVSPPSGRTVEDTAAILGGIPRGAIAGIIVDTRLLEKTEVASALKQYFPDLPVFNHEGERQILENTAAL